MSNDQRIQILSEELNKLSNPAYALQMQAYMKDKSTFIGIQAKPRNEVFKSLWTHHGTKDISECLDLCHKLWQMPEREYQYIAMEILDKMMRHLSSLHLPIIENLITSKSWWDTVDMLATHHAGACLAKSSHQSQSDYINKWIESDNLWLQRTSIIYQLHYKEKLNFELLTYAILGTLNNRDFFIRKAAGWVLRQHSKKHKYEVTKFLEEYGDQLSPLTIKEASKYI
jgi:3-methyladenine DNA glycosylase AlkD